MICVQLGDAFEFIRNGMNVRQSKEVDGLPISRIETISDGMINPGRVGYAGLGEDGNEKWILKKGDILFSHINSVEHIGKCAIYNGTPEKLMHGMNLLAMRPALKQIDPAYAFRVLSSPSFRASLQPFVNKAVNQASISTSALKKLLVPLPPLNEQRRIAAILDKADALRRKRKRVLDLLDNLAQSVFISMFGYPSSNSLGLKTAKLGDLGNWRSGGTPPRSNVKYFSGTMPWFSSGELNDIFISDSIEHISEHALRETSASLVRRGSLLLGMYDTAALKSSIATIDCSCNQAIAFAEIDPTSAEAVYVYYAIQIGKKEYKQSQRGIRQKNLNLSLLKSIIVPLPDLQRQTAFVQICHSIFERKDTVSAAHRGLDSLFASLQHRAFSGQL